MPTTGSNLTRIKPSRFHPSRPYPRLDEQSFQGLLAAAFTIQEHNDRLKLARTALPEPEAVSATEANGVCSECGDPTPSAALRCPSCDSEELRPGERLQRNWASMWLLSQDASLRGESPAENGGVVQKPYPPVNSASNGLLVSPVAKEFARETRAQVKPGIFRDSSVGKSLLDDLSFDKSMRAFDKSALDKSGFDESEAKSEGTTDASPELTKEDSTKEKFTQENPASENLAVEGIAYQDQIARALELSESDAAFPPENVSADTSLLHRFADLSVKLSFNRADLYLTAAVLVALLALLWPAATLPRRPALRPWQRALITLGLAEAPTPVVHLQGDPGIQVWVDPHTALYYCPGEDQYGKTADGRLTSQREAQMERFDPAGRSACE